VEKHKDTKNIERVRQRILKGRFIIVVGVAN
jgi:hypothetical protein